MELEASGSMETPFYKLVKVKLDVDFLKRCKIFGVTPKFIRFRLYKRCLHKSAFYKKKWQCKLLLRELENRKLATTILNIRTVIQILILLQNDEVFDKTNVFGDFFQISKHSTRF